MKPLDPCLLQQGQSLLVSTEQESREDRLRPCWRGPSGAVKCPPPSPATSPYPVEAYPVPGAPVEASSHLVLDNCLLRPIPLISHVNLHRRLVCLGSKLTNMRMVGKGHMPESCPCCPGHPSGTGPSNTHQEQQPPRPQPQD